MAWGRGALDFLCHPGSCRLHWPIGILTKKPLHKPSILLTMTCGGFSTKKLTCLHVRELAMFGAMFHESSFKELEVAAKLTTSF